MKTFTSVKLIAEDGMILTNGTIYGKVISLGNGDSTDNYHEITEAEYAEILANKEAEMLSESNAGI